MFDFTPVGLAVAIAGLLFIVVLGWRLVPARQHQGAGQFNTGSYLTEARVRDGARAVGKTIREVEEVLQEADAQVIGMVRNQFRVFAPNPQRQLHAEDILVIEAEPESLGAVFASLGLDIEVHSPLVLPQGSGEAAADGEKEQRQRAETELQELAVMPNSLLIGRSARSVRLRAHFGLNLLAISRQGRQSIKRLRSTEIQAGDVLLLQGEPGTLAAFASEYGCVPLAGRSISIPDRRKALLAGVIMALAIGGAAFGLVPAAVSFAAGVVAFMLLRIIPLRRLYEAIDWPVIVLLGSLIPVAVAMESTGFADLLARSLLDNVAQGRPVIALALILIVAMTLSDFMNNAATAAVMCPIAISAASQLEVSPDAFLMAVAVGASCAFLTPIGHQNNTLILGPGGFRFADYWRLGLPMEVLVVAVAIPGLLYFWPL
jgi:di/tricarboxylate transporter